MTRSKVWLVLVATLLLAASCTNAGSLGDVAEDAVNGVQDAVDSVGDAVFGEDDERARDAAVSVSIYYLRACARARPF